MPHNREERTEKLQEIKNSGEAIGTKPVLGVEMEVYEIPVEYLIFNKENGRIGSKVKTWENINRRNLDQENYKDDFDTIAKFIWDSNPAQNKKTTANIKERKQEVAGEVTSDGVVVGGNRRLRCLLEAGEPFMKCVILDEKVGDNVERLLILEKTLQNTVEGIVGYNANEKYFECLEMVKAYGAEKGRDGNWIISDSCFQKIKKSNPDRYKTKPSVHKDLKILEMMEEYLEETGNPGCYTMLADKEDYFKDLPGSYEKYIKGTGGFTEEGWNPSRSDVATWKRMCFAVTKAGFQGGKNETKEYRKLFNTSRQGRDSFFGNKEAFSELREDFKKDVFPLFDELKSMDEISQMDGVDPIEQSKTEEKTFKDFVDGKMVGAFNKANLKIQEKIDEGFSERMILQAWNSIKGIVFTNSESWPPNPENLQDLIDVSNDLRQKSEQIYKEIKKIKL
jgi:hypothetical protein